MKYLDKDGLTYLWGKIKAKIPTKTSDLTNDSGYLTSHLTAGRSINITNNAINNTGVTDVSASPNEAGNGTVAVTKGTATGTQTSYIKVKGINNGAYKDIDNTISAGSSSTNLPTSSAVASFVEGKGYIASETDPVFSASPSSGITSTNISNWNNKQDALVSGTNIKTINSASLLGSGNLDIGSEKLPIGSIKMYAGSIAPDGYLFCNGQAVSRTTYSDLFDVIGTTYGAGDGSTTFNLPNLKGRVAVGLDGSDTDFDTLGLTGGSKNLQSHYHDYLKWYTQNISVDSASGQSTHRLSITNNGGASSSAGAFHTGGVNSSTATGNSGNLQPYITLNYIIKASDSSMATLLEAEVHDGYNTSTIDAYSCNYINSCNTYSTDEVFTGKYWKDGKPIYRKYLEYSVGTSQSGTNMSHNLNIDSVVNVSAMCTISGQTISSHGYRPMPQLGTTIGYYFGINNITTNSISFTCRGWENNTAFITLEYTKTTD